MTEPKKPSGKGRWKKLPEDVRRAAILDAALGCFARKGYSETSVQDIAAAAGMTKGGVYFHFDSKAAIRAALIETFTRVERLALQTPEVMALAPPQRLKRQLRLYLDGLQISDAGLIVALAESVTRFQVGIPELKQFYGAVSCVIVDTINEGQAGGYFRRQTEADRLAEMVLSMIDGLALHHELDSAGMNLCAGADDLIDLLVDGL